MFLCFLFKSEFLTNIFFVITFPYEDFDPAGHLIWGIRHADVWFIHNIDGHGYLRSSLLVVHYEKIGYNVKVLHKLCFSP